MKIYFNLVEDTEGIFDSSKVLIFSSGKDYVSNGYSEMDINIISIDLKKEMENIYSYDEKTVTESQLLFELKTKGFERSELLQLFEEDNEYVEQSFEEIVNETVETKSTEKTCTCPNCGKVYNQREIRELEFLGDCYFCDECEGEIPEKTVIDSLELAENELRCPDCGSIDEMGEFIKITETEYECSHCGGTVIVSVPTITTTIEFTEEVEEDSESEDSEEVESISSTTATSTPVPTSAPVAITEIKSWNDLIGNIDLAYSFLKNYIKIGSKGINEPIIVSRDIIKNSELLDVLEENGIITNEYRTDFISKYYSEDSIINSKKAGSIDGVASFVLLAMGCSQEVAKNLPTVYSTDVDKFNDLYIYWQALMMAKELKYSKTIFKNAMSSIDKSLKTTKPLFSFESLTVPTETKDFVIKYKVEKNIKNTESISTLEDESGNYSWFVVKVPNGPIQTKYIMILDEDKNTEDASNTIVRALSVRGLDVSTAPLFKVPSHVTDNDIPLLLSGIPGLKKGNEESFVCSDELSEEDCSINLEDELDQLEEENAKSSI